MRRIGESPLSNALTNLRSASAGGKAEKLQEQGQVQDRTTIQSQGGLRELQRTEGVVRGTNLTGTAADNLGKIAETLRELRGLAEQATKGRAGEAEQARFAELKSSIDATANWKGWDDVALNGSAQQQGSAANAGLDFKVGELNVGQAKNAAAAFADVRTTNLGKSADGASLATASLQDKRASVDALARIDQSLLQIAEQRKAMEGLQSEITDAVGAQAEAAKAQVLQQADTALLAQANQAPQAALRLLQ